MDVNIEEIPKSKLRIKISLSGEEFSPYFVMGAQELSKNLNIPGFRSGKVPADVLEEKVGKESILEEAANIALKKSFGKIVLEKKLEVLGPPEAKIEKLSKEEFEATIEVATLPKVKLPEWKEIVKAEAKKEVKVEEKEVEASFDQLRKSRAKYTRSLDPAKKGNEVIINCEIRSGGAKIENGDVKGQRFVLGEKKLVPGFQEQLFGMRENEEKNFSIKAPDDFWQKEFQGKMLDFKASLKEIYKVELPDANNEFASSLGKFKNIEELKKNIHEGIEMEKKQQEDARWQSVVLENIAGQSKIDLPDVLVENERDRMTEELKKNISEMGLSFDQYLSHLKKKEEDLKKDFLEGAEKRVKIFLSIYEIAKQENIEISDQEIKNELNNILAANPSFSSQVKGEEGEIVKSRIKETLIQKKVIEIIRQQV